MVINYESYPTEYQELFQQATKDLNNFLENYKDIDWSDSLEFKKIVNGQQVAIENQEEWNNLKEEVKAFGTYEKDGKINSLEDYFSYLKLLGLYFDTNYQILPLEEPTFDIDLNTRSIKLPSGNYTYAVSGDHMAETIYFRADRYFDNVDLNDMDIAVLVKTTEKSYLIPATIRDITSQPNKIIFGWPISEDITGKVENIEFSVRFYKEDNTGLLYNLSTTTNKLQIKSGLIVDNDINRIDLGERAKNLLKNYPSNGTAIVLPPELLYYSWKEGESLLDTTTKKDELSYPLCVLATTTEDSKTYKWKEITDKDNSKVFETQTEEETCIRLLNITSEDFKKYMGYLYTDENGTISAKEYDETATYYLKVANCTITKPGSYFCEVEAKNVLRSNTNSTPVFEVPSPGSILVDVPEDFVLGQEEKLTDELIKGEESVYMTGYFVEGEKGAVRLDVNNITNSTAELTWTNLLNGEEKSTSKTITAYSNPTEASCLDSVSVNNTTLKEGDNSLNIEDISSINFDFSVKPTGAVKGYTYQLRYTDSATGYTKEIDIDNEKPIKLAYGLTYTIWVKPKLEYKDITGAEVIPNSIDTKYSFSFTNSSQQ